MYIQTIQHILAKLPASVAMGSGRALTVAIEFAASIYLMRLLGPEPFGLVAMATSLLIAFSVVKDAGAGSSLVSDKHLTNSRVGAAILISFIFGMVMMLIGLACTPLVVHFYDDDRLAVIWIVVCLSLWITAMISVPNSLLQRQQKFGLMAWLPLIGAVVASTTALLLVQVRQDYWPILIFQVIGSVFVLIPLWLIVRPQFDWPSRSDLREVFHFGKGMIGFDLVNVLNRYADNVIIGFYLGSHALGLYLLAYKVLMIPLQEIGAVIRNMAYPRLSNLAPQWDKVGLGLAQVTREVAMFATPLCLGIALAAPELIHVIFGAAWSEALIPLQVLAILGIVQVSFSQLGLAFPVTRNTGEMARWAMLSAPAIVLSFFTGIPWGITGVAIAYTATSIALMLPMLRISAAVLGISSWLLAKSGLIGISIGFLVASPLVVTCLSARAAGFDSLTVLVLTITVGALSELGLYFFTMRRRQYQPPAW